MTATTSSLIQRVTQRPFSVVSRGAEEKAEGLWVVSCKHWEKIEMWMKYTIFSVRRKQLSKKASGDAGFGSHHPVHEIHTLICNSVRET